MTARTSSHRRVTRFVTRARTPRAIFPDEHRPDVSVVVVTYGTGEVIVAALESIAASTTDHAVEVIVVDNPHPDRPGRSSTYLRLFTNGVHVVAPTRNLGFGGGCELGVLGARGDVLVFANPDVVCPPGWLDPLVETVSDPDIAIVAPVLLDADGGVQEAGQQLFDDGSTAPLTDLPDGSGPIDVDYASAACWVMRRDTHERLGGFDPAYHPAYFEDVDLALRARSLGTRVVVDARAAITHLHGQGTSMPAAPAFAQRDVLMSAWPDIVWRQPSPQRSKIAATIRRA